MKYFIDGDQLVITKDNFVDLQESPAVFYPIACRPAHPYTLRVPHIPKPPRPPVSSRIGNKERQMPTFHTVSKEDPIHGGVTCGLGHNCQRGDMGPQAAPQMLGYITAREYFDAYGQGGPNK